MDACGTQSARPLSKPTRIGETAIRYECKTHIFHQKHSWRMPERAAYFHTASEENMTFPEQWPPELPVVRVRVARPTDRLEEVVAFYRDGIGLPVIGSFEGHAGYSGVMLGLPGTSYHLEFTHYEAGSDCPAPSKDNLLVFYLSERKAMDRLVERLNGAVGLRPSGVDTGDPNTVDRDRAAEAFGSKLLAVIG